MKLLIYGTFPANDAGKITRHLGGGWDVSVVFDPDPVERKAALLAQADVMVTSVYRAGDPPAPRLRLLQCSSAGTDSIAIAHLPPGCIFCNVRGHEIAIAEYVTCAILDWSIGYRRLTTFAGEWSMADWLSENHDEAYGKSLGIVGFGSIGRESAMRARALGMRITALSTWRHGPPDSALVDRAYAMSEWKPFLADADFILVCAPLTPDTRGMIDAAWFAAMKPNAVLIHVGRGPVIDEQSLFEALRDNRIRGASLDVWYTYPRGSEEQVTASRFPFFTLPNVIATAHKSGHTNATWDRRFHAIAQNLEAFAEGRPLADVIAVAGEGPRA